MQNNNTNDEQRLGFLGQSYRFKPTDEELVSYLERKLAGHSISSDLIPQVDIYKFSPHQLKAKYQRNADDSMLFFSTRNRKCLNGTRPDRRVGDIGYWKASRTVHLKRKNRVVGIKMILNFHVGTPKKSTNTHWIMEEFVLKEKSTMTHENLPTSSANHLDKKFDDFCLYKIHYHKTKADKKRYEDVQEIEIPKQVPQNRALELQSPQNQPYWIMPIDTFNPATASPASSTQCLSNCQPIRPFLNNGNCLLPEQYMGESTFSMPSMPLDTFFPATSSPAHSCYYSSNSEPITPIFDNVDHSATLLSVSTTSTPADSTHYLGNCEPITPIFNNVDHLATLLPEPSMEDSATMFPVSTASTPAIESQSQQNHPSMIMSSGTFNAETSTSAPSTATANPSPSTQFFGYCESITDFLDNGNFLAPALLQASSMGDSTFSTPSMPLDAFIPAAVISTASQAHQSYYSSNSEAMEDMAALLSVSTATTPAHSTPVTPSMPYNDNGFMLPRGPTVDEQSTTQDFDAFNLWNWNF